MAAGDPLQPLLHGDPLKAADVDLAALAAKLGHAFTRRELAIEALTHRGTLDKRPDLKAAFPYGNERLEFLGDRVLSLAMADLLLRRFPDEREGQLARRHAALVSARTLGEIARSIGLSDYRIVYRGAPPATAAILADMLEALLGAIFLDAGYDAAYHYYLDRFRSLPEPIQDENFKGRLQQIVQERYGLTPYYDSAGARGGRQREYTAVVYGGADPLGTGHGSTKQAAEQEAARSALSEFERRAASQKGGARKRPRPAREPAESAEVFVTPQAGLDVDSTALNKAVALAQGTGAEPGPEREAKPRRRSRRSRPTVDQPGEGSTGTIDRELVEAPPPGF